MFIFVITYILWMFGVTMCSIIKCFAFEPKKSGQKLWYYVVGMVLVQLPVLTVKFVYMPNATIRNICLLIVPFIYIAYLKRYFQCYVWQATLLVVFEFACSFVTELIVQVILREEMSQYTEFVIGMPIMALYAAISYIIMPILFFLVLIVFKRIVLKCTYDLREFYVFSIFPISQVVMLFSVNKNFLIELTPNGVITYIGMLIGILADALLLITLLRQQRMQELSVKMHALEQTWEVEQNHYADIETRREELAKIRHDLSEQFMVIQELLRKKEYDKVEEMVSVLEEDVAGTREYVYCGDSVVNAILAENERKCLEYGIRFEYDLQIGCSLKLNPVVICSVFSNLMRNAIAAARETKDKEQAFVSVKADVKGDYLHIKVKNSYSEIPKKAKEKRKGYGLSILKALADQYSGHMEQNAEDGVYSVFMVVENIAEK